MGKTPLTGRDGVRLKPGVGEDPVRPLGVGGVSVPPRERIPTLNLARGSPMRCRPVKSLSNMSEPRVLCLPGWEECCRERGAPGGLQRGSGMTEGSVCPGSVTGARGLGSPDVDRVPRGRSLLLPRSHLLPPSALVLPPRRPFLFKKLKVTSVGCFSAESRE